MSIFDIALDAYEHEVGKRESATADCGVDSGAYTTAEEAEIAEEGPTNETNEGTTPANAYVAECGKSGFAEKAPPLDAETLHIHLSRLYVRIREGCLAGLHCYLQRTNAETVKAIIGAAGPGTPEHEYMALCRQAGDVTMLAAIMDEYRYQVGLLQALDPDGAFRHAAALELCLMLREHQP